MPACQYVQFEWNLFTSNMIGVIVCNKFAEFLILFCIEFKRKMQCFLYQVQDYTNDFPKDVIAVILALHNETCLHACTCECHL